MNELNQKLNNLNLPQPIAIIGAGVTGKSCFDLLQNAGIAGRVFDERDSVSAHFTGLEEHVQLGAFHADTFTDYGTVLLSPGVDTRRECFAKVQEGIVTDIELFARLTEKPVIGVTGSNGKSTVVTLLHQVTQLAGKDYALCGNIGLPVLQALMENEATCDGYIIELSSYHLERAPTLKPRIGVWLNVSPDHLDRYDSYDHYVNTKANLFKQSDINVINADDPLVYQHGKQWQTTHAAIYFSQQLYDVDWLFYRGYIFDQDHLDALDVGHDDVNFDNAVFALKDFAQIGTHHADNLMAVFAVAGALGIDPEITARACKAFQPLPCRAVVIAECEGVTFINDSKGTNIGATVASLNGIEQPIILLAGGQGKDQDFKELAEACQTGVKAVVLFGQDASLIEAALSPVVACQRADDLPAALAQATQLAQSGDVVLLSPACASFDSYPSYLKRGEHFETLVKAYIEGRDHAN
ncbi:MAG: UDP-N-acetylmuramoyl-L-alanine--D-glutamate ligase [Gammaproteobacteria bacterium]|nr:MAG: UDP-N-acetylmuramoyl-L-alanine--D-glutamate ligase [Gammaproteobacteria bacterium]